MARTLTPYQRIVRAAARGKGVVLSSDEVQAMSIDSAISQLAENDDEDPAGVDLYGRAVPLPAPPSEGGV